MGAAASVGDEIDQPLDVPEPTEDDEIDEEIDSVQLQAFELIRKVGQGAFASVWKARRKRGDQIVAIKVQDKDHILETKQARHVIEERNILARMDHPYIVQLLHAFQNHEHIYLVLTWAEGGDLSSVMLKMKREFDEAETRFYSAEIALALFHLHSNGIIFRDMKPENVLVTADRHFMLTDFGLAKDLAHAKAQTLCGTAEFMAPESWKGDDITVAVDWWAFGCVLYLMLVGSSPFFDRRKRRFNSAKATAGEFEAIGKVLQQQAQHVVGDARVISAAFEDVVAALLEARPSKRMDFQSFEQHAWHAGTDWDAVSRREVDPPDSMLSASVFASEAPGGGAELRAKAEAADAEESQTRFQVFGEPSAACPDSDASPQRSLDTYVQDAQQQQNCETNRNRRVSYDSSAHSAEGDGMDAGMINGRPKNQSQCLENFSALLETAGTQAMTPNGKSRGDSPSMHMFANHAQHGASGKSVKKRRASWSPCEFVAQDRRVMDADRRQRGDTDAAERVVKEYLAVLERCGCAEERADDSDEIKKARADSKSKLEMRSSFSSEEGEPRGRGKDVKASELPCPPEVRRAAVKAWCSLRTLGCKSKELWSRLLCDTFVYTHPVTPYRYEHVPSLSDCGTLKILVGIDHFLKDIKVAERRASVSSIDGADEEEPAIIAAAQETAASAGDLATSQSSAAAAALNPKKVVKPIMMSSQGVRPFENIVLSYVAAEDDVVAPHDASRCAFVCTMREQTSDASTVAMGIMQFRGGKVSEMVFTLDVLGFSKGVELARAPKAAEKAAQDTTREQRPSPGNDDAPEPPPNEDGISMHSGCDSTTQAGEPRSSRDTICSRPSGSVSSIVNHHPPVHTESSQHTFTAADLLAGEAVVPASGLTRSHYRFEKALGQGAFGKVWLASDVETGAKFAIKALSKKFLLETGLWRGVVAEKLVLEQVDHPFVVRLRGSFQDAETLYLVLDFVAGGTLAALLEQSPANRLVERSARLVAAEVLLALDYLHSREIVFRDLKPENVLMSVGGHAVLTDFGSVAARGKVGQLIDAEMRRASGNKATTPRDECKDEPDAPDPNNLLGEDSDDEDDDCCAVVRKTSDGPRSSSSYGDAPSSARSARASANTEKRDHRWMQTMCGSPLFMAPEAILGRGYGREVDFWSFGVLVYVMLAGKHPFAGADETVDVICNALRGTPRPLEEHFQGDSAKKSDKAPCETAPASPTKRSHLDPPSAGRRAPEGAQCEEGEAAASSSSSSSPPPESVSVSACELVRRLLVADPRARLGGAEGTSEIRAADFFEGLEWSVDFLVAQAPPELDAVLAATTAAALQNHERAPRRLTEGEAHFKLFRSFHSSKRRHSSVGISISSSITSSVGSNISAGYDEPESPAPVTLAAAPTLAPIHGDDHEHESDDHAPVAGPRQDGLTVNTRDDSLPSGIGGSRGGGSCGDNPSSFSAPPSPFWRSQQQRQSTGSNRSFCSSMFPAEVACDDPWKSPLAVRERRNRAAIIARFFQLRSSCCVDVAEWSTVVDELCVHSQPRLPYRKQHTNSSVGLATQRVFLVGVADIVADNLAAGSSTFLDDLSFKLLDILHDDLNPVSMFQWEMRSLKMRTNITGGGRVRFSKAGLIKTMDIVVDVHGFMDKLVRAKTTKGKVPSTKKPGAFSPATTYREAAAFPMSPPPCYRAMSLAPPRR